MQRYQATILQGGRTLFEDLPVYLEELTEQSGLKTWYGVFQLQVGEHIEPGGPYDITLEDGRSGQILVSNIMLSSHSPTQVSFQGTGPLAEAQ